MAENAHDKWAKELDLDNGELQVHICQSNKSSYHSPFCFPVADFLSHQLYQPYELLDEVIKDKDRTYALDLLRYLRVSGFELNRTRVRMSTLVQSSQGSQCQEKFAIQLFGKALELLEAKLEMGFYLRVLFPMLTSYLNCHAGYFMPMANQRSNSFASQEEKSKILKYVFEINCSGRVSRSVSLICLHAPLVVRIAEFKITAGHFPSNFSIMAT